MILNKVIVNALIIFFFSTPLLARAKYDLEIMNETFLDLHLSAENYSKIFLPYGKKTICENTLRELCKDNLGNCHFTITAANQNDVIGSIIFDFLRRRPSMFIISNNKRITLKSEPQQDGFALLIKYAYKFN